MKIAILVAICVMCLLVIWFLRSRGRGYEDTESAWDGPQIVDNVISDEECKYIIERANNSFARSTVVGVNGPDESRTSETAWIDKNDYVAQKILKRACDLTGKSFDNVEDLQVVKYRPGTFYRAHHDACCEDNGACTEFEDKGGQRVGTLLVYLNDEFTDGETHFPEYGDLKLKADPGSGIFFKPLGNDGKCHPKALHAGLPVSSGVKYVCNAWVREENFV